MRPRTLLHVLTLLNQVDFILRISVSAINLAVTNLLVKGIQTLEKKMRCDIFALRTPSMFQALGLLLMYIDLRIIVDSKSDRKYLPGTD